MAAIKSTLDLIMEKTSHLSLNEDERTELERETLAQKVRGPAHRFLQEERDASFLLRELDRLPVREQEAAREMCIDFFLEWIHPDQGTERVLEGVEALLNGEERRRWEPVIEAQKASYTASRDRALRDAEQRLRSDLAAAGIAGPAVRPCVEMASPEWKDASEERLRAFRDATRQALGRARPPAPPTVAR